MIIKSITAPADWERFIAAQPHTLFVQSIHYGEFYESMGEQSWLFGVYKNDNDALVSDTLLGDALIGGALVVSVHARRGNFLYIPYGPVLDQSLTPAEVAAAEKALFETIKKMARTNKYHFLRVSPFISNDTATRARYQAAGFRAAPIHALAEYTWLLDIRADEPTLLANMEKNHRNLIRRCEREGVRIDISATPEAVADFNRLHDTTASRHKFHRFSAEYITKEFQAFATQNQAVVIRAYLPDGTLDSAGIFMYYGSMGAYRHGASLVSDKKIPSSYLLQWEAIREAKRRGMMWYNFWGIAPDSAPAHHPFRGITHFKKGFGGSPLELLNCQDLPLSPRYWLNWLIEKTRSVKRGFK